MTLLDTGLDDSGCVAGAAPGGARVQDAAAPGLSSSAVWHHAGVLAQGNYTLATSGLYSSHLYSRRYQLFSFQDPMKRPTFETLQWKLEDFFTMSDSEYKEASQYWH